MPDETAATFSIVSVSFLDNRLRRDRLDVASEGTIRVPNATPLATNWSVYVTRKANGNKAWSGKVNGSRGFADPANPSTSDKLFGFDVKMIRNDPDPSDPLQVDETITVTVTNPSPGGTSTTVEANPQPVP